MIYISWPNFNIDNIDLNWPGWPLSSDPFGNEFDIDGRKRMIIGSRKMMILLKKYENRIWKFVLEIWPFFNPLITNSNLPNSTIVYRENDPYVLKTISKKNAYAMYCDLKYINWDFITKLKKETNDIFESYWLTNHLFDSIVISQVFNYIDYKFLLFLLKAFIKPKWLIFVNNVTDYWLPFFFSDKKPKNIKEILNTLNVWWYKVIDKQILKSDFPEFQKNDRLILVAENESFSSYSRDN